jgi:hypothetical protein
LDVDRIPELIEAADPPEQDHETPDDGWAELAARYDQLTGVEFIRLPAAGRRAAVRARLTPNPAGG